jgi:hypothetical protein
MLFHIYHDGCGTSDDGGDVDDDDGRGDVVPGFHSLLWSECS